MFPTNSVAITGGSSNTSNSSFNSAAFTLPENCLVFFDIRNQAGSTANTVVPTLTGTGGETWVLVGTVMVGTVRRATRYACMVQTSLGVSTTVTMHYTANQTFTGWQVTFVGGCDASGVNGSNAWGNVTTGSNPSIQAFTYALNAALSSLNGQSAFFASSSGAQVYAPRAGWTELAERDLVGEGATENQFIGSPDTTAGCTASSSAVLWASITTECLANPTPIYINNAFAFNNNGNSTGATGFTHTFNVNKGSYYIILLHTTGSGAAPTISNPDFTFTLDHSGNTGGTQNFRAIWRTSVATATGSTTFTTTRANGGGGGYYNIHFEEIVNVSKLIQLVDEFWTDGAGGTHSYTTNPPSNINNIFISAHFLGPPAGGLAATDASGWQRLITTGDANMNWQQTIAIRNNSQIVPTIKTDSIANGEGVIYEFQATGTGPNGNEGKPCQIAGPFFQRRGRRNTNGSTIF